LHVVVRLLLGVLVALDPTLAVAVLMSDTGRIETLDVLSELAVDDEVLRHLLGRPAELGLLVEVTQHLFGFQLAVEMTAVLTEEVE
jgi:hypothetical protein